MDNVLACAVCVITNRNFGKSERSCKASCLDSFKPFFFEYGPISYFNNIVLYLHLKYTRLRHERQPSTRSTQNCTEGVYFTKTDWSCDHPLVPECATHLRTLFRLFGKIFLALDDTVFDPNSKLEKPYREVCNQTKNPNYTKRYDWCWGAVINARRVQRIFIQWWFTTMIDINLNPFLLLKL